MNPRPLLWTSALLLLGTLAPAPAASADPSPGTGVCFSELYQPGYDECFGTVQDCGGQSGMGVGHWYWDRSGNSYTWCYVYV